MGHRGCVVWFTGLSGSGKSTVANLVDHLLWQRGAHSFLLDGDNVRHSLTAPPAALAEYGTAFAQRFGLGFSDEDRQENMRRVGAVCELFVQAGLITLVALVSPFRQDRQRIRQRIEALRPGDFFEVWVDAPLEVCEARDPKGFYRRARAGQLPQFTGISSPYEPPLAPELHLDSANHSPDQLAGQVMRLLEARGVFSVPPAARS
ncbi:MAG: adenylyl-sulfate kinase [Pirellulaceae bacterium]|nr:MAG: adenylyl-sulfate kinase [Pirellulaceae bacterium]